MPARKKAHSKGKAKVNPSHKSSSTSESVNKDKAITGDMTLGELVAKHPEAVDVMLKHGLHCVGCHMAAHETIEQGALAHGMDAKAIGKMLKEMNSSTK